MVRPVMYWSFAKRWMTSSMVANMRGNPCGWGLADERTLTHGLGQDNKSAAWRASEGAAVRDRGMPRCERGPAYGLYCRLCFLRTMSRLARVCSLRIGRRSLPLV